MTSPQKRQAPGAEQASGDSSKVKATTDITVTPAADLDWSARVAERVAAAMASRQKRAAVRDWFAARRDAGLKARNAAKLHRNRGGGDRG